jgi:hypothetical protein
MEHVITIAALVLAGPLVGVELGVAAFTTPLVDKLPDTAYRQFRSGGGRLLGALMPLWYIGTFCLLIAAAALSRHSLAIVAVVLMAAAVLLSVTVLVPINNRVVAWRSDEDVDRGLARRWDRWHALRVGLLAAMFVTAVISVP